MQLLGLLCECVSVLHWIAVNRTREHYCCFPFFFFPKAAVSGRYYFIFLSGQSVFCLPICLSVCLAWTVGDLFKCDRSSSISSSSSISRKANRLVGLGDDDDDDEYGDGDDTDAWRRPTWCGSQAQMHINNNHIITEQKMRRSQIDMQIVA